ncbi:hypothetical protein PTMSG1_03829 [Pyrenophora teres f. maculata]|nr:hypothetical protein PTMSG1_03829 [Pyrenophora teres f. maculata]
MSSPLRKKKLVFPRFPEEGPNAGLYSYDYPPLPATDEGQTGSESDSNAELYASSSPPSGATAGEQTSPESDPNADIDLSLGPPSTVATNIQSAPAVDESLAPNTETTPSETTDENVVAAIPDVPIRRRRSPPAGMEVLFSLEDEEAEPPAVIIPVSRPPTSSEPLPLPETIYGPVQRSSSRNREQVSLTLETPTLVLPPRGRDLYPNVLAQERRGIPKADLVQFPWQSRDPYQGLVIQKRNRHGEGSIPPLAETGNSDDELHPNDEPHPSDFTPESLTRSYRETYKIVLARERDIADMMSTPARPFVRQPSPTPRPIPNPSANSRGKQFDYPPPIHPRIKHIRMESDVRGRPRYRANLTEQERGRRRLRSTVREATRDGGGPGLSGASRAVLELAPVVTALIILWMVWKRMVN